MPEGVGLSLAAQGQAHHNQWSLRAFIKIPAGHWQGDNIPDESSFDGIGLCPTFESGRWPVSVRDLQPKQCSYAASSHLL